MKQLTQTRDSLRSLLQLENKEVRPGLGSGELGAGVRGLLGVKKGMSVPG